MKKLAQCGAMLLLYVLHLQLLIPAEFLSADIKADTSDSERNTSVTISITMLNSEDNSLDVFPA